MLVPLLYRLLPQHCLLCHDMSNRSIALCAACEADLPFLQNPCATCGVELISQSSDKMTCGQCLKHPPRYQKLIAPLAYEGSLPFLMGRLKFGHRLLIADIFSNLLLMQLKKAYRTQTLPEMVIPVPLHKDRLRQRGFNQALQIAKPIAQYFNRPIEAKACQRIKATHAQALLPLKHRAENMKDAFRTTIRAQHVALIDDVVTSGSTVDALCQSLQHAGVKQIDVWCLARTLPVS